MHAVQARLRELAQTDPLTGLYNRRGFRRIAEREIERSKRTRSSLTLVHLDLDGFKALNDRLGHAEGDDVLVAVGHSLKASRAIDVASRLGRSARTRR
jgi:diguanylate cyclase (GGDEF)-like protein